MVVLGGLKVSDKITLIRNMLGLADAILIGGAMANAFLAAQGLRDRAVEGRRRTRSAIAADVLAAAQSARCELLLPVGRRRRDGAGRHGAGGHGRAPTPSRRTRWRSTSGRGPPRRIERRLREAGTIYWNGPMGLFEVADFAAGTQAVGEAVAASSAVSVAGGGDTVAALRRFGLEARLTHVSTGGGASMEFLEGRALPGVEALMEAEGGAHGS